MGLLLNLSLLLLLSSVASLATSQSPQSVQVSAHCAPVGMGQRLCVFNALNAQLWWLDSGGERQTVWISDYYRVGDWSLSPDGQYLLVEAYGFGGPQHIALIPTESFFTADELPVIPAWQQTYQLIGDTSEQSSGEAMGWLDEGLLVLERFGQVVNGAGSGQSQYCLRWVALPETSRSRSLCGQAIGRLNTADEAKALWRRFSPE